MQIGRETKIRHLLESHPFLLEYLASLKPEFAKLRNPVLRNTVARVATLAAVAEMGGMDVDELIEGIANEIAKHEIHATESAASSRANDTRSDAEARARRQEELKAIIGKLHDGASVDDVKAEFDALTSQIDAVEIAAMEQSLIADGMPVEEVQRLCDVHVSVFRDALENASPEEAVELPDWHPVTSFRRENAELAKVITALRCLLEELAVADGSRLDELLAEISPELDHLALIDVHYLRKENQLFPMLENHGIEGPTKVMWAIDDDIRARIKDARRSHERGAATELAASLSETLGMVEDMIYKEENILFPTSLEALSDAEWEAMAAGEAEIGFAWIEPPSAAPPAAHLQEALAAVSAVAGHEPELPLTTGALTLTQLDLLARALPFDITYVDEHDRVRFYSEGDRVFARSPAVIGREVKNCHPPKSVDVVERILNEFKSGSKDLAEFWIELGGRFIHIRYFALRDAEGTYRGCLEVVQDATAVRALEGERRLLDW